MDKERFTRLNRLIEEVTHINLKISKLVFYIFTEDFEEKDLWEQELMRRQLNHMQCYRNALIERIDKMVY